MSEQGAILTEETFRFFRELARNNRKPWMDANRDCYRAHVVEPFRLLLARLAPAALKLHPGFEVAGRTGQNFSRINRDIRFANDKSPYRAQLYLFFRRAEDFERGGGQLYVGVSGDAVTAGFRIYFEGRESALARVAIPRASENGKTIERQRRRLAKKYDSYWYTSEKGTWTKHGGWPRCFGALEQWKKMKGWIVRRKFAPAAAKRAGFVPEVARIFREVFPLYEFTTLPEWRAR